MDAVINLVNLFFGAQIGTILGASDALTVLRCACGGDYGVACELMDEQWGESHAAHKLAQDLVPAHELLSASIEALNGAQRELEVEGGWEAIDEVVRRYLVPGYGQIVADISPREYAKRGGWYDGSGVEPAVTLLKAALSGWCAASGAYQPPVILAGQVRIYDEGRQVWDALATEFSKPALALQAAWREMMRARVIVERSMAKVAGSKEKVPKWSVADVRDKRWDRLCHAGGEWTLGAVPEVSGEGSEWVKGGLHLQGVTLHLAREGRDWVVKDEARSADHHALYALPYTAEAILSTPAPRFEALLDNLTAGYSEERRPRVKSTIKRWMGLALLGAGALGVELPLLAITGGTGTGKSTLLLLLKSLLPREAVSACGMKSLLSQEAYREAVIGKVLNVDTELSTDMLQGGDVFKQIMSSEPVSIWSMGRARYAARLTAMFATAGQNTPRFKDLDTAVLRRVVNVSVERGVDYRMASPIAGYHEVIVQEEGAGVIGECLAELHRGQAQGLSIIQVVDPRADWLLEQQAEIRAESNTAVQFWRECVTEGPSPSDKQRGSISLAVLYKAYLWWCEDTRGGGGHPQGKGRFRDSLAAAGCEVWTKGKHHYFPTAILDEQVARGASLIKDLPPGRVQLDTDEVSGEPWHH